MEDSIASGVLYPDIPWKRPQEIVCVFYWDGS